MLREKAQAAQPARPKVPMRRRGADCSVLAMKRGNARRAKGAGHRHWVGPTGNGRSLIISGRRQPSRDGTSRMNREVHVRICERLGVRFPGPTRQSRRGRAKGSPALSAMPRKRRLAVKLSPFAMCHERTHAAQQIPHSAVVVYSITSSARSRIDVGIVIPSALAVLRLITNPNS